MIRTDEDKTKIDREALERYCEELPGCSTFLQNFFLTCGPFEPRDNLRNFLNDLESYGRTNRRIRANDARLRDAFFDIVDLSNAGLEERGLQMPDDPSFSHYVVEGQYAIGEAKEVEHESDGISSGYVKLWGMEEFAEYGSIESRNLISKKALKFMGTITRGLHEANP